MKEQKINLKEMNKENKQKAINIINKTKKSLTKIADQNDDGIFDKEDITKSHKNHKHKNRRKSQTKTTKKITAYLPCRYG